MNTVNDTLKDRDGKYGDYAEQAACAQRLKAFFRDAPNWNPKRPRPGLSFKQQESLDMIAAKISRLLHGDPNHADSWHDIAGYAELGNGWKPIAAKIADQTPPP